MWHLELFPFADVLKRVAVWLHIPGLPIEYYNKHILWSIGDCLGRTVKIDSNTLKPMTEEDREYYVPEGDKFARLCAEIHLRKILRSRFELNGKKYKL